MTKKLNWSLILPLKDLADYLTNYELIDICLNKTIRNKLKHLIFNNLNLFAYEFSFNEVKYEEGGNYPEDALNTQLKQLNQEFINVESYIQGLIISNSFNHITLLSYSSKFNFLIKLSLSGIRLPSATCKQIFDNLQHLEYLYWVYSCIVQWKNTEAPEFILPTNLKELYVLNLQVKEVDFIRNPLLLNDSKLILYGSNNQFYTFKAQKFKNLKTLSIPDQLEQVSNNINNFLSSNFETVKSLQINILNFNSKLFSSINSCHNLKSLILHYYYDLETSIVAQPIFPMFNHITRLEYETCHNNHFEFNKKLMLSFPNLNILKCFYLEEFKSDLVQIVNSLKQLSHLTLINWRSPTINFNINFVSNSLTELSLENFNILQFNPIVVENCFKLIKVNLIIHGLGLSNIDEVTEYFDKFSTWKTIIYPSVIRLYNANKY